MTNSNQMYRHHIEHEMYLSDTAVEISEEARISANALLINAVNEKAIDDTLTKVNARMINYRVGLESYMTGEKAVIRLGMHTIDVLFVEVTLKVKDKSSDKTLKETVTTTIPVKINRYVEVGQDEYMQILEQVLGGLRRSVLFDMILSDVNMLCDVWTDIIAEKFK